MVEARELAKIVPIQQDGERHVKNAQVRQPEWGYSRENAEGESKSVMDEVLKPSGFPPMETMNPGRGSGDGPFLTQWSAGSGVIFTQS
jgi:hypothetical protein